VFDGIADVLAACGAAPLMQMPGDAATAEPERLLL
jgi:hypothetical protein